MSSITQWQLSPFGTLNADVLALSEPREDSLAYSRGYLRVVGVLDLVRKKVTEWTLPQTLFPDAVSATGFPIEVSFGQVTWTKSFISTAVHSFPPAIVTIVPKGNRVRVHRLHGAKLAIDYIVPVRATKSGDVWFAGRTGGPSGSCVIGRMRPDAENFDCWALPLGFGLSTGLAVEADGLTVWTTWRLSATDHRQALLRLRPQDAELTSWALPDPDGLMQSESDLNMQMRGPVVATPMAGQSRSIWWLLTSAREGPTGRLVRLNPSTGDALDYGPMPPAPANPGGPTWLTLDVDGRPWVTFKAGFLGTVASSLCEHPIEFEKHTWTKLKPKSLRFVVEDTTIAPTVSPIATTRRAPEASAAGCFKTYALDVDYPFMVAGSGVPLASGGKDLFVSNGVDRILQFRP